jgi:hypothetical protein
MSEGISGGLVSGNHSQNSGCVHIDQKWELEFYSLPYILYENGTFFQDEKEWLGWLCTKYTVAHGRSIKALAKEMQHGIAFFRTEKPSFGVAFA